MIEELQLYQVGDEELNLIQQLAWRLATSRVLTTTAYFRYSGFLGIFAILAAVFLITTY